MNLLTEHGYELATATTGSDGLRLFMSKSFDAVILEYYLGLINGAAVADAIKFVRPDVPVVMLAEDVELPSDALKSVDALVARSDGPHFLLATVHFVLNVQPAQRQENRLRAENPAQQRRPGQANTPQSATDGRDTPFSRELWRSIRSGNIQF